ncbi:hypothetical protein CCP4SC76_7420004 [Gammaproteobacteria bacterium]
MKEITLSAIILISELRPQNAKLYMNDAYDTTLKGSRQ